MSFAVFILFYAIVIFWEDGRAQVEPIQSDREGLCTEEVQELAKPYDNSELSFDIESRLTKTGDDCSICMLHIDEKDGFVVPECYHKYHKECIYKWFRTRAKCPLCQRDIKKDLRASKS